MSVTLPSKLSIELCLTLTRSGSSKVLCAWRSPSPSREISARLSIPKPNGTSDSSTSYSGERFAAVTVILPSFTDAETEIPSGATVSIASAPL